MSWKGYRIAFVNSYGKAAKALLASTLLLALVAVGGLNWSLGDSKLKRVSLPKNPRVGTVIDLPLTESALMKFAWVPPGDSWLGGGDGTPGTKKFKLKQGLWSGVYPVTQAEWQEVMGNKPSRFKNKPRYPVECVSWNDVQKFIERLNQRSRETGVVYRLPTEEEWEYICRGGPLSEAQSKYLYYFARTKTDPTPVRTNDLSSTQANFDGRYPFGNADKGPYLMRPCKVGSYLPNPLGIYDLQGNVWQWTSTKTEKAHSATDTARVIRGGGWSNRGFTCAARYRAWREPDDVVQDVGFRLVAVPSCPEGNK
jgi:eukaryotic-like serine/threonine-protein kinase